MCVPLVGAVGLLLHDLEDALAGAGAVVGIAVDGDRLLHGAHVVLAVHVDARAALLCDEADGAALAADDGANHVALHQQAQGEVCGARLGTCTCAAAGTSSTPLQRLHLQPAAVHLHAIESVDGPETERTWVWVRETHISHYSGGGWGGGARATSGTHC